MINCSQYLFHRDVAAVSAFDSGLIAMLFAKPSDVNLFR